MSDTITIPLAALGPLLAFANAWLERGKRKGLENDLAIQGERIVELERQVRECQDGRRADWERWAREVVRGAQLAAAPAVATPPAPEWEEPTGVRLMRAELEAQGLREALRRYVEEPTPPRGAPRRRMPSQQ